MGQLVKAAAAALPQHRTLACCATPTMLGPVFFEDRWLNSMSAAGAALILCNHLTSGWLRDLTGPTGCSCMAAHLQVACRPRGSVSPLLHCHPPLLEGACLSPVDDVGCCPL